MKKFLVAMGLVAFAVVGCDDSSSASAGSNDEPGVESSSSSVTLQSSSSVRSSSSAPVEDLSSSSEKAKSSSSKGEKNAEESSSSVKSESTEKSSSSEKLSETSSSSADEMGSSSSKSDVPQSYAEAKVMPSGTYDCTKYKCVTTEYLNQEFLEAGKYGEILDERDGLVYKTVKIGEQTWMAQNLNYAYTEMRYVDIGHYCDSTSWCYDNKFENCTMKGRLYTWWAAIDSAKLGRDGSIASNGGIYFLPDTVYGVCPIDWHLPTRKEWLTLFDEVGGQENAGLNLRSQTGWGDSGAGTDVYGFSALPAGFSQADCCFNWYDDYAHFWTATDVKGAYAYYVNLYVGDDVYIRDNSKQGGRSVRCMKN